MARLHGTQLTLQRNDNHTRLKILEEKLQEELSNILKKEELMWFQRSLAKWLTNGYRNTKFYHFKTIKRICHNKVVMLMDE